MNSISAKAETIVRATPTVVFDAFVEAETMSIFWFTCRGDRLQEGQCVSWFIGTEEDAYGIEVHVIELSKPELIRVDWGDGEHFMQVVWRMQETNDGQTRLSIEESGFKGSNNEIISSALDSTGGLNQMIIALKALVEHGAIINVVEDRA